jgi:hypothetical protein
VPIIASAGENTTNYTPAPEGTHQAVCVDVIDKGMHPNKFKDGALQHKIDIAWQINELRDDGKRFVVYKRYTLSLHEKANLRHDLESWRGRPFTRDEEMGFDVESVIGANCLVNVQHKPSTKDPNKVFANVVSVMPLIKGMPKIAAEGYARPEPAQTQAEPDIDRDPLDSHVEPSDLMDSDIPFAWLMPFVLPATGLMGLVSWA